MEAIVHEPLSLSNEEAAMLAELLDSARTRLLVEIRRTHHRPFRTELENRLRLIESLLARCG